MIISSFRKPSLFFKHISLRRVSFKDVRLSFHSQSKIELLKGINQLVRSVQKTLGPAGRNVALEYEPGEPKITKDGVTVAKNVHISKREPEMGCKLLKRSAGLTNNLAGDGTTTSTVLAGYLIQKGFRVVDAGGAHPMQIKQGMNVAASLIISILEQKIARQFKSREELEAVVKVACNYDQSLARIVTEALVGKAGQGNILNQNYGIRVEQSWTGENELKFSQEIKLERGYVSASLLPQQELQTELEYPVILVVSSRITQVEEILPALDLAKRLSRPLLVFSESMEDDPLSIMVYNNKKGDITSCAINIPYLVGLEKEILKDIAVLTGATLLDNEYSLMLKDVTLGQLGSSTSAVIGEYDTILSGTGGHKDKIAERIKTIRDTLDSQSPRLKQFHSQRLVSMQGGEVIIGVGGRTEVERNQNHDKVIDALNAGKAGLKEGLLPGSGMALYNASLLAASFFSQLQKRGQLSVQLRENCSEFLQEQELDFYTLENEDQYLGARILCQVCEIPARKIIENSGHSDAVILSKIKTENEGFDARRGIVVDLFEESILDTLLVVRTALQNAVSTAGMILSTECNVVRVKDFKPMPLKEYDYLKTDF